MHPALRVALAVVGALFGANLQMGAARPLAVVVGALAGLAIGEVVAIRAALGRLRSELETLRAALRERRAAQPEPAAAAERPRPAAPPIPPIRPIRPAQAPPVRAVVTPATTESLLPERTSTDWKGRDQVDASFAPSENPVFRLVREYFTGGNALVRTGVVVLFFGVAFLLRYLAEHTHVPIELRLSAIASGALVLLVFGWRLRTRRPGYALALQGGGIGILYLTIFSALHLYSLLTAPTAFALLAAVSALAAILAVLQNSLAVALLATTGGFLAPFLASSGSGNHVALFSYFVVLNVAILGIAWFRAWRPLNVAGFMFTFVLSTVWGVLQYRPQDFTSTEPFLVAFFLIYLAIAVLYSTRQTASLDGYIDGTIIFGTPIAAFGLQAAMLHDQRLALAYSALAVSAVYISLAWLLHRRQGDKQRLLVEAFTALGVAFLTLAIPLALNGRWSAVSWALEGAALIWVGCRQNRRLPRAFGALLQLAAGGALMLILTAGGTVPAGTYVAELMVGMASVYAAVRLHGSKAQLADYEQGVPAVLFFWGLLWWCMGGVSEIGQHVDKAYTLTATLLFATATALLCSELTRTTRMRIALLPAFALLPAMLLFALRSAALLPHPLAQGGWIGWPLAFLGFYLILRRQDEALEPPLTNIIHACTLWLLTALASWEVAWTISQVVGSSGAWSAIGWAIVPVVVLALLPQATRGVAWPLRAHREAYLVLAGTGIALYLGVWSLGTNLAVSSPSAPLPYLPLLNPLDIAQGLVLFILIRFWVRLRSEHAATLSSLDQRPVIGALALLGFVWLNAVLLRTLHHWAGIPYEIKAMVDSTLVQSALSIFWALLALTTMLIATRIHARVVWLTGAALLVVVIVKLFLVDLASIGTIERIVSFVGVGLLMLVIGYFSPLPPVSEETAA